MISEKHAKTRRRLSAWSGTRIIAGVLVIVATIATVLCGTIALKHGENSSLAMKVPCWLTLVLLAVFIRAQKRILALEAKLRVEN